MDNRPADVMEDIRIPAGYGQYSRLVTWPEFVARHLNDTMEPEFKRRTEDAFWYAATEITPVTGIRIGIGSGGPRANPSPISWASRMGLSMHQLQRFRDGRLFWMAYDMVVWVGEGEANRSPRWEEVQFLENFGIHAFIGERTSTTADDEPWHAQAIEVRGHAGWVTRGRQYPVANYQYTYPGPPPTIPPPIEPPIPPIPPIEPPTPPTGDEVEVNIQRISNGSNDANLNGSPVRMLQDLLNRFFGKRLKVDGAFGDKTEQAVREAQDFFFDDDDVDGRVGPQTWDLVLNGPMSFIN